MRQDFGVRLGAKDVATLAEGGSQRTRVFDDAVMDQRECAAAVGVRVRVDRRGGAVRGPARVGDARAARGELLAELFSSTLSFPGALCTSIRPSSTSARPAES